MESAAKRIPNRALSPLLCWIAVLGTAGLGALGAAGDCQPPPSYTCAAPSGFDPWSLVGDFSRVPTRASATPRLFSSYDRGIPTPSILGPLNKDNNNFLAVCGAQTTLLWQTDDGVPCDSGANGYLLAKVDGQGGYISRMWFATGALGVYGFHDQRLVIYVDDLTIPAVDLRIQDIVSGTAPSPFVEPFAGFRSGGVAIYAPVAFKHTLRVYMRNPFSEFDFFYYHVDIQDRAGDVQSFCPTLPAGSQALLNAAAPKLSALGTDPNDGYGLVLDDAPVSLTGGGAETVLYEDTGSGTIEALELALPAASQADWDDVVLRLTWDQAPTPAVEIPVRRLFGLELEAVPYQSLFLGHRVLGPDDILYLYLPMPYRTGARVAIVNNAPGAIAARATIGVDAALPPEPFGALHAVYSETVAPPIMGPTGRHLVADLAGSGTFVGVGMTLEGHQGSGGFAAPLSILEGDPHITVDGAAPLLGTGNEEIADGAWYFQTGPFDSAFSGATIARALPGGFGESSLYRWYSLSDGLDFTSSLHYEVELSVDTVGVIDRYATVAWYYAEP